MNTFSKSLSVKNNYDLNCLEVTNILQGVTFKIDMVDIDILNIGKSIYLLRDEGYLLVNSPYGNRNNNIPLHRMIMQNEINEYCKTHNDNPVVIHINGDKLDNRRCNLKVMPSRYSSLNFNREFIGVEQIGINTFRMQIKDPNTKEAIKINYNNKVSAAISYDYYANKFYPNESDFTNLHLGKFTQEQLESHNIHSLNDMYDDTSAIVQNRKTFVRGSELDYYGVEDFDGGYRVRVKDNEGKLVYIGKTKDPNKVLSLVCKRENYIIDHNLNAKSNLQKINNPDNKLIIAGILKRKWED